MSKHDIHEIDTESILNLIDIVDNQIKWMDFIINSNIRPLHNQIENATNNKSTLLKLKKSLRDDL